MSTDIPHEANRRLRRAQDRLREALTAGRVATWEWDPATDTVSASEAADAVFGLKPGQSFMSAARGFDLVHPEDRDSHRALVEAAVRDHGGWHNEFRIIRPVDGKIAWLAEQAHTVRNPNTGRYAMLAVVWDVTESKQAEQALRENEARQAFLLRLTDRLGQSSNPREIMSIACESLGRHLAVAAVQYGLVEPDQDRAEIAAAYNDGRATLMDVGERFRLSEQVSEWAHALRSGVDVFSEKLAAVALVKSGRLVAWMSASHPTARGWSELERSLAREVMERTWLAVERAQAQEAVRRSEANYRALFTSMDQGFCIQEVVFDDFDRPVDVRYLEVNRAFEQLTGLRHVVGRTAHEMMLDVHASWLRVQAEVALSGEPVRFENYVAVWDKWFDIYSFRIGAPAERKVASIFTDITVRRRIEEQVRRAAELDAFRVALSDALRALDDPLQIQSVAAQVLGESLKVNRVSYVEVEHEDGADYFHVKSGYRSQGLSNEPLRLRATQVGGTLLDELRAGRIVAVSSVEHERRFTRAEREAYVARGVRAFIEVPRVDAGRLAAVLTVQQNRRRDWGLDEVARIEETAQRTWAAVERARAEAALRRARAELEQRVEERTRELEQTNASLRAEMAERRRAEETRHELLRQLVNAQEVERRRISRELHDDLGQLVSALVLKLSMMRQDASLPPGVRRQVDALEKIARDTDSVLDFAVWQLRPTALDDLGLVAALGDYLHNWSGHFGIDAQLVVPEGETIRLDPETETVLYRAVQEALNNIAKHARAKHVEVSLERGAERMSLVVSDDGVGFDTVQAAAEARGLGLVGMRERAAFIGGDATAVSTPGGGTRIIVDVPLHPLPRHDERHR